MTSQTTLREKGSTPAKKEGEKSEWMAEREKGRERERTGENESGRGGRDGKERERKGKKGKERERKEYLWWVHPVKPHQGLQLRQLPKRAVVSFPLNILPPVYPLRLTTTPVCGKYTTMQGG